MSNDVITNALANLSGGKNVQVDQVLKLNKTEVMDLILEEVIGTLDEDTEALQKEHDACEKQLSVELVAYVKEYTGFSEVHGRWGDDGLELQRHGRKAPLRVYFSAKEVTGANGPITMEDDPGFSIPAPEWGEQRLKELEEISNRLSAAIARHYQVTSGKTKFKSMVIRSLLNEHDEGKALLSKVKEIASTLTAR